MQSRATASGSDVARRVLSLLEFSLRLAFFAGAPFIIVVVAALFPVHGVLIDVAIAMLLFAFGDRARTFVTRFAALRWLLETALSFEDFYRKSPPRVFLYYLLYPLLFPYWLLHREARREFLVFRGYTLGGLVILLATLAWQYFRYFPPELGLREYFPLIWQCLVVEMLLALALLMPLATTFVTYHGRKQHHRRNVLLAIGFASSVAAIYHVAHRRDPVVTFATSERVSLRSSVNRREAHQALLAAVRAARIELLRTRQIDGDGKVMGAPLATAQQTLLTYYKSDEVLAFDLWASPRRRPRTIVLYHEAAHKRRPVWVAVDGYGKEIRSPDGLPRGAFEAMRAASDGTETLLEDWPSALDLELERDRPTNKPIRGGRTDSNRSSVTELARPSPRAISASIMEQTSAGAAAMASAAPSTSP